MAHAVLLTVSGRIPADLRAKIERGERPQADYMALADTIGADLVDYAAAEAQTGRWGRWLRRLGGENLRLAWACFQRRRHYQVIFTDGEQVGLPLAALLKLTVGQPRPRHLMIVHILSVGKKMLLLDWLSLASQIDLFLAYSTWQKRFIETRWRIAPERVVFTPFMVDARFFVPSAAHGDRAALGLPDDGKPIICSAGLEYRDYDTLIEAVKDLDAHVVLAAASPWSKRRVDLASTDLPMNVIVRRFSQFELRQLYALSAFMVMPLHPVAFQAGVTAILEAMAMNKAVICTRTPGQTDVVVEGETGLYVEPQDAASLRAAIAGLLHDPAKAENLGHKGRQRVLEYMSLDRYCTQLNQYVQAARVGEPATT